MNSLFALVAQYRSLDQLDIDDIDDQTLQDTLEGLTGEVEIKAAQVALFHKNIEALADSVEYNARKMRERANRLQDKADRIKQYLKSCMEAAQLTKIETAEVSLKIKKNPPRLVCDVTSELSPRFLTYSPPPDPEPNREAIGEAIDAGEVVPGWHKESLTRLEIKV